MVVGYSRVSTEEQNLELQLDALDQRGCEKIFKEKRSAFKTRPKLIKLLTYVREGDTVVVWRFDRIGRSMKDLISILNKFEEKGVHFVSIQENIDTNTPLGKLMFHVIAAFAQFEHDIIVQRTKAGLAAARKKGHFSGRPKGLSKASQNKAWAVLTLEDNPMLSVQNICDQLEISRATYYRYGNWAKEQKELEQPSKTLIRIRDRKPVSKGVMKRKKSVTKK